MILEHISEDLYKAVTWGSTGEVRELISDALDEFIMAGELYEETLLIPLKAYVHVYNLKPYKGTPGAVRGVRYLTTDKELNGTSLTKLTNSKPTWYRDTGSPTDFAVLDFGQILIYPCPSTAVGMVSVDTLIMPDRHSTDQYRILVRRGHLTGVIDYVLSELYLRRVGMERAGLERYADFLASVGDQEAEKNTRAILYRHERVQSAQNT